MGAALVEKVQEQSAEPQSPVQIGSQTIDEQIRADIKAGITMRCPNVLKYQNGEFERKDVCPRSCIVTHDGYNPDCNFYFSWLKFFYYTTPQSR